MYLLRRAKRRLVHWLLRVAMDQDMDEEMRGHLEMEIEANLREGMDPEEARRMALIAFGGMERFREQAREARRGRSLDDLSTNLKLTLRKLRRRPAFTLVVILTLGLGIGASTAIFSVVDGVLLKPLPYSEPDELLLVWDRFDWVGIPKASLTGPQVTDLREQASLLEGVAAFKRADMELTGLGDPSRVPVGLASANFFSLLGIDVPVGRAFSAGEDLPGTPGVVVLTHGFWQRRFAGDPDAVGRVLSLNGQPVTVVGVLPSDFNFKVHRSLALPSSVEIWMPLQVDLASGSRGNHEFAVLSRMKDGVSPERMMAEMEELGRRQDEEWFGSNGFRFSAQPVQEELVAHSRPVLLLLLTAVALLLLIAIGNIVTLMLAKAQTESREVGVRAALGASRGRIFGLVLTEVGILAVIGGGVGLFVAFAGLDTLVALAPETLPRREDIAIDLRVFAVASLLTLLTTVLCSFGPAVHNVRVRLETSLREGSGRVAGLGRAAGARKLLVVSEVALSIVLVIGAGLLLRSLNRINHTDPGFSTESVTTFGFSLPSTRYPSAESKVLLLSALLDEIGDIPGVAITAGTGSIPVEANNLSQTDVIPDALAGEGEQVFVDYMRATPGYLETMGIDLVSGRGIQREDRGGEEQVAVIDESLARYWPQGDAVGKTIRTFGIELRVVGVVRHARIHNVYQDDRPQMYIPFSQFPAATMSVAVRSDLEPAVLIPRIREKVGNLDANLPLFNLNTMKEVVRESTSDRRFATTLLTAFALVGLSLAILGVYGILANTVADRRREIGIRIALGAPRRLVEGWIIRQGLYLTALGVLVGLLGAVAGSRLISGLVFQVSPVDPMTYVLASVSVLLAATLACLIPARRASRTDVVEVLGRE